MGLLLIVIPIVVAAAFGQAYNVATGSNYTVNFLYQSIGEILGISHPAAYREPRQGDIRDSLADISKAQNLLGYYPTQQFMDGLKLTVDYFRALNS